ncbi:MAG TPA: DNA-directed RNA polymerase subunit omega [Acidobacteriaceae bacterium]|jgi:hypothetical protein
MRTLLMNQALNRVPNRFALCQILAKVTRRMHKPGDPFQSTVTSVLGEIEEQKLGDPTYTATVAARVS